MRYSNLVLRTLREAPADAEAISHQLLVRSGYIRRVASGVYAFLPLGWRVIRRLEALIREEMEAAGAQEVLLPILHPAELYDASGRRTSMADILMELDAKGGRFVLGPTHEEVVTAVVSADIDSYRDLPVTVFQIQTKFRDEARPRFGLLRTRELLMKDAYSFDVSPDAMAFSYEAMRAAYARIFTRCDLPFTPVEASSGAIGGDVNHEFMIESAIGEDHFARCDNCGYSANVEAAQSGPPIGPDQHVQSEDLVELAHHTPDRPRIDLHVASEDIVQHHTPGRPGIELVVEFFAEREPALTASGMLKCFALKDADAKPVVILVPGDREVRIPVGLEQFDDDDFAAHPELVKGYIGPMGLRDKGVRVLADHGVRGLAAWVTGANRADHHVTGATYRRDFTVDEWGSFAVVADGDPCPRCSRPLALVRAVEAGHTFQLGLKYSRTTPGATFKDESGADQPLWMGCYGIGISRLMAVIAEAHHDHAGLVWPATTAPFDVHLIGLRDTDQQATALYETLIAAGTSVLYDDRDVSPGIKFADADLLGIPTQLIIGTKGLARASSSARTAAPATVPRSPSTPSDLRLTHPPRF